VDSRYLRVGGDGSSFHNGTSASSEYMSLGLGIDHHINFFISFTSFQSCFSTLHHDVCSNFLLDTID
jgi:hypothetical protein